jgi:hypothetical protein
MLPPQRDVSKLGTVSSFNVEHTAASASACSKFQSSSAWHGIA